MKTIKLKTLLAGALVVCSASTYANDLHVPSQYATIQAAADAAVDGDTIHIAPGVYTEQAHISDNITLQGQPGTILRAFPYMADLGLGFRNILLINGPTNVTLRGLAFEGDQLADQQPTNEVTGVEYGTRGVYIHDCGGVVEDCTFSGFRESGSVTGEVREVIALAVYNDLSGAPLYDFRIAGNTIVDCQSGIHMQGTPETNEVSLNVTIENNNIQGIGPTEAFHPTLPFTGIALHNGITGTVTGNTVAGFSYAGTNAIYPHFGVRIQEGSFPNFEDAPTVFFERNTFRDNDLHLMALKSDNSQVLSNRFEGTGVASFVGGVLFSGDDVTVQGNKFFDMPRGIVAFGDDPDFGLIPGIATNAVITDNRFCNVDTNIFVQPLATATETGTLECPFPDPVLDITKSVLLSWPEVEEGFVVECAPSMDGPWTNVTATYFLQEGNHAVSVPADGEQKYFRLVNQ